MIGLRKAFEKGANSRQLVCEWSRKRRQDANAAEVYRDQISLEMLARSKPDVCD
jgi:hypothetical protein